ncbi:MAG TPA: hypothetical protein VF595_02955 [Tepidisphaeraceae bacterium]|jgi:hypothetical protein
MSKPTRLSRVVRPAVRSMVENLEQRRMLTVTTINGTSGDDYFTLTNLKAGDQIIYNGKGGHDHFVAYNAAAAETILGQVTLKSSTGGTFELDLYNDIDRDHQLKVGKGKITGFFTGSIDYSQTTLKELSLFADSKSASTAELYDTAGSSSNYFNLAGKWDVKLGNDSGTLSALKGYVSVSTYPDSGSVVRLDAVNDTANRTIEIFGNQVAGLTQQPLSLSNFNSVRITAGSGDKNVKIALTDSPLQFTSFDGQDNVTVGYKGSLDYIKPGLKIGNIYGKTALKIDAAAETAAGSFVISPKSVAFTKGDIAYFGDVTLSVATGKGSDSVFVNGTNANPFALSTGAGQDEVTLLGAGGTAKIDGGTGSDQVTTGSAGKGNLALFAKGLNVIGTEAVSFSDQGQTAGHHYAVGPTSLVRDYNRVFNFAQAKSVTVRAGAGHDTIDAYGASTATSIGLYGNAGNDKLTGHKGSDSLYGGDGYDTLIGAGGLDKIYGGYDDDLLKVAGNDKATVADGENGVDQVRFDNGIVPVRCEHLVHTVIAKGNVYTDSNQNGTRDGTEKGKAGVQVWADVNNDGLFGAGDIAAFTDSSGNYTLHDLNYGFNTVRVLPPAGSHQTNNSGKGITFGATAGATKTGVNFGLHSNN